MCVCVVGVGGRAFGWEERARASNQPPTAAVSHTHTNTHILAQATNPTHLLQALDAALVNHRRDEIKVWAAVLQQPGAAVADIVLGASHVVWRGWVGGRSGWVGRVGWRVGGLTRRASAGERRARARAYNKSAAHPPSSVQNAISGSIIQNSARWRAVWEFSARKVGPKV